MEKVLHITPHMGGGVGKVLSRVCSHKSDKYAHSVLMLEKPQKNNFVDYAVSNGVSVTVLDELRRIPEIIKDYDIIQIEWWQHPKTMELLAKFPETPCRLVVWAHVNGCHYPYLSYELANYANMLFTTEYSLQNPYWTDEQRKNIQKTVVRSSGGFEDKSGACVPPYSAEKGGAFNIGYVGTLSFSKLNRDFMEYCREANVPGARFTLVGDNENEAYFASKAEEYGVDLRLCGYVDNPQNVISGFDVFGYPLSPVHFGTTENALLEAMALGVVPVCLNQNTERYIIKHSETGFLANSPPEYGEYVRLLYDDRNLLLRMSRNAREHVLSEFSLDKTVSGLEAVYDEVCEKSRCFKEIIGSSPFEWFLSGLREEHRKVFELYAESASRVDEIMNELPVLGGESKGSVLHFYREFCV